MELTVKKPFSDQDLIIFFPSTSFQGFLPEPICPAFPPPGILDCPVASMRGKRSPFGIPRLHFPLPARSCSLTFLDFFGCRFTTFLPGLTAFGFLYCNGDWAGYSKACSLFGAYEFSGGAEAVMAAEPLFFSVRKACFLAAVSA